jgi:hypothetical protein
MTPNANRPGGGTPGAADCKAKRLSSLYKPPVARPQAARFRARDRAAPIRASRVCEYTIPPEPRRVTLDEIEPMLTVLPDGRWIARDGRVVIFNRHYTPIWERLPNGTVQRANPHEWVDWTEQGWFDLGSMRYEKTAREAYRKVLKDFLDDKPLTVANDTIRRRVRP